ncbi:synaptic vesicle 2-related protein [Nephila pilipes]|uniref:Synaptic vesicle 2-related protein n=1 Tax=Nephila pilipes TaxID=299642 RepID=A0A8X6UG62_NEPPI|nr:synaptic vesicle 2-related protein [Nephila pilipes]
MFWRRKKDNSESETKTTEDVEGNTDKETTEEKVVNDAENSETKSNDNKESVSCDKEENENEVPPTKISYTGCVYDIDNVIDEGGFGKYQWMVTFLGGMIWFAAASQIMILTLIGDLIACTWNIYRSQNALLFSVVFFCMSIGSPIFGYIGDNYGRKKSIGLYLLIQFSFGAGSAAANSIHTMIFLMAFVGLSLGGEGQIIAYVCEFYPVKDRGIAGFYTAYFWTAATLFLLFICWGTIGVEENWRGILFIAALPALINLLFIKWYPESPRYFLISEQPEKATKRLEEMASMNKVKMPEGRLKPYKKDRSEESGHFLDLFKPERRWSTVLKCFLWFSTTFTYYAYALITPMIIKNGTIHFSKEMLVTTIAADNSSGVLMNLFPCNQFTSQNYKDLSWITSSEFLGSVTKTIVKSHVGNAEAKNKITNQK